MEMTPSESIISLEHKKKGLAYRMWKESYLTGLAFGGKKYPRTPQEASPDLYPKQKTIAIPEELRKKMGGK